MKHTLVAALLLGSLSPLPPFAQATAPRGSSPTAASPSGVDSPTTLIARLTSAMSARNLEADLRARGFGTNCEPVFRHLDLSKKGAARLARYVRIRPDPASETTALRGQLDAHPSIEWWSRGATDVHLLGGGGSAPNDPYYASSDSWDQVYRDQWGLVQIQAEAAWATQTGDPDLVIAVLDTGVDYDHPELADRMWVNDLEDLNDNGRLDPSDLNDIDDDGNGYVDDVHGINFASLSTDPENAWEVMDTNGHGTHIAGIIAAETDNALGIAGVNWNSRIMALSNTVEVGYVAEAVTYAVDNGARLINVSWFLPASPEVLADAIAYAHANDVAIVAAAGNSRTPSEIFYPQSDPHVILVSASDPDDEPTVFTCFGVRVDVAAPGGGRPFDTPSTDERDGVRAILSTRWSGLTATEPNIPVGTNLSRAAGTSFSAPFVVGVASLMLSEDPGLSVEQLRQALHLGAAEAGPAGWDEDSGFGRLDALGTLQAGQLPLGEALVVTPKPRQNLRDAAIDIVGTAWTPTALGFSGYVLDWGVGTSPTSFSVIGDPDEDGWTATSPVQNGTLASSFDATAFPQGQHTLRLRVFGSDPEDVFEYRTPFAVGPQTQAGFPVSVTDAGLLAAFCPTIPGDVDGDGDLELVAAGGLGSNEVYVFSHLGALDRTIALTTAFPPGLGGPGETDGLQFGGAALGELDSSSPGSEIVVATTARIYAFYADGTSLSGWPVVLEKNAGDSTRPILADLDGDGEDEVLMLQITSSAGRILHAYSAAGSALWNVSLGSGPALAVGNVVGSSLPEIVAASGGSLQVFAGDGSLLSSTSLALASGTIQWNAVALADVQGDRHLDIAVACSEESLAARIWIFDGSLNVVSGWPQDVEHDDLLTSISVNTPVQILFSDVDGDLELETTLMLQQHLYVHDADGTELTASLDILVPDAFESPVSGDGDGDGFADVFQSGVLTAQVHAHGLIQGSLPGFPVVPGDAALASCVVVDLDGDGDTELVQFSQGLDFGTGSPGVVDVWDLEGRGTVPWPMAYANAARTSALSVLRGDADQDGTLTEDDGQYILNYLYSGGPAPICLISADANSDGQLTISDPLYIYQHLNNGGPPPAE